MTTKPAKQNATELQRSRKRAREQSEISRTREMQKKKRARKNRTDHYTYTCKSLAASLKLTHTNSLTHLKDSKPGVVWSACEHKIEFTTRGCQHQLTHLDAHKRHDERGKRGKGKSESGFVFVSIYI